jgi:hypothetical protein
MKHAAFKRARGRGRCPLALAVAASISIATPALADEGGVSFWLPGLFGSLAAVPQQPGFSFAMIYYHTSVDAGADVAFARQVSRGRLNTNFTGNLSASLNADAHLGLAIPTYTFESPLFGARASVSLLVPFGRNEVGVDATLTGALGPIGFTRGASRTDTVSGFGDLAPQFALRWNMGVHNWMTYITGGIPVGSYDSTRLANLGIGHGAIDWGGGYTYFNPATGHEFSAVGGFTYNFENPDTDYKSGVDFHLDMAASQFLSKQFSVGVVGYAYQQVTGDSGSGARLGDFKSRVFGIGPQLSYIFPISEAQGVLNLKGYKEFAAENRPEGWNVWLTFQISPAAAPPPPVKPMIRK